MVQDGLPHGTGTMETHNSIQLTYVNCEFSAGKPTSGKMTCTTGEFVGTFAELGAWTAPLPFAPAQGRCTTSNGFVPWTEMDGVFLVAKSHFNGTVKYANGEEYAGNAHIAFSAGTMFNISKHGTGRLTALATMCQGSFVNDDFVEGTCTYSNNDVYDGQMVRGKKHGRGKLTLHQGFVEHDGRWKNDEKFDDMSEGCCAVQ